jgi:hypothetical protein
MFGDERKTLRADVGNNVMRCCDKSLAEREERKEGTRIAR